MTPLKKLIGILPLAIVLGVPAPAFAGHTYKGRVVSAQSGRLVLAVGTEQLTFLVATDTRIFVDGAPAELDKIERGYSARVKADRLGEVFVARKIICEHCAYVMHFAGTLPLDDLHSSDAEEVNA